jgi:hypothetical protein
MHKNNSLKLQAWLQAQETQGCLDMHKNNSLKFQSETTTEAITSTTGSEGKAQAKDKRMLSASYLSATATTPKPQVTDAMSGRPAAHPEKRNVN